VIDLPAGVIPVYRSTKRAELARTHEGSGVCPFDDPDSDLYSPVAAPADSEEW
jgi:hypothetical protein